MSRTIYVGETATEVLPVYEANGYTPHTGLVNGNFTKALWKDGAVDATSVTVAEIGTSGYYKATFTPASAGAWELVITNSYNSDAYHETYDVRAPVLLGVA